MPDLLSLARAQRRTAESKDEDELQRIIDTFQEHADALEGDIDALSRDLADSDLAQADIESLASYQRLIKDTDKELGKFEDYLEAELILAASAMIALGLKDSIALIMQGGQDAGVPSVFASSWDGDTIKSLLGFLDPAGPLFERLAEYGATNAQRMVAIILESVKLGTNPRQIAQQILREGLGMALTDALRMVRTVQLWSYREATRLNYQRNSDVVTGWVWLSALIPGRTCMACVVMHGTVHGLDESLNDHHNGLCTMLPLILGRNPVQVLGEEWFNRLSSATQKEMMGPGKYEAWKAGRFAFADMVDTHTDDVYGSMRVERTLKSLLGE